MTLDNLFQEWRARGSAPLSLDRCRSLGKLANNRGEALLAFDIANESLATWPDDKTLKQIMALALARMGSTGKARQILTEMRDQHNDDEETLGLIARTYKDVWLRSGSRSDLTAAFEAYLKAYQGAPRHYWTGINAASLAFALQDRDTSAKLAQEVLACCQELRKSGDTDYWTVATMAEAELILDRLEESERDYRESRRIGDPGNLLSTWRNACILLRLKPQVRSLMERAFRPPKVGVLTAASNQDTGQLRSDVETRDIRIGYSSAAAGQEIEFLQAVRAAGGQVHIVLPFNEPDFINEQAASGGEAWRRQYAVLRDSAEEIIFCSDQKFGFANVGDEYAESTTHGLAKIRARQLDTDLVVFGGRRRKADSGATDTLPGLTGGIRAMIFADAFHFSHLSERAMPAFISQVMDRIAALIRNADPPPEYKNTWGDGLFLVFEDVIDAGRFALDVVGMMRGIDRNAAGLPPDLDLRIALHAGPVYQFADQIAERRNYLGWHVNRAARIEPITRAGAVYVTDAFAAAATLQRPSEFAFEYVGRVPLAKGFGESRIFELKT